MAPGVVTLITAPAPSHPARLDGAGADRSWPLCPLALSAHCPPGLASVSADQPGSQVPARRPGALVLAPGVGRAGRATLARVRHRVSLAGLPPGVHAGGLVGRGP